MTKSLDDAMRRARSVPPELQDEVARLVLSFADDEVPAIDLSPEEEVAVLLSRSAAERGEFATDEQRRSIWAKHGL